MHADKHAAVGGGTKPTYQNTPLSSLLKDVLLKPIGTSAIVPHHDAPIADCNEQSERKQNNAMQCSGELIGPTDLASLSEFIKEDSRLCVYKPDSEIYLCMSTADYYLVDNLKNLLHSFENGSPLPTTLCTTRMYTIVPPTAEAIRDDFTIVRAGGSSRYFEKYFSDLEINYSMILQFVRDYSTSNPTRDGDGPRCRLEFGCAGDGWEQVPDSKILRPYLTCGLEVFDKLDGDKKDELKYYYAQIMDRMQMIHDEIEVRELNNERPYNFRPRTLEYGCALREAIGASVSRMEWLTTQVKILSDAERTDEHKDKRNCNWAGYSKTGGLCFMLKSKQSGIIYSLKFIANSRMRVGDYYGDHMAIKPILARIKFHTENIDQAFALMYKQQLCNQSNDPSYQYDAVVSQRQPTHLTFYDLVLNDWSPWTKTKIGRNPITKQDLFADVITMPANIVRSFFLSPACTVVYRFKQYLMRMNCPVKMEEKLIEVAIMCGYQTAMIRPFVVAGECVHKLDCNHPSKALHTLLTSTFGSLTGSSGGRRLNPTGLNFKNTYEVEKTVTVDEVTYEDDATEMNGVMKVAVTHIQKLMDSLNDLMESNSSNHDKVKELVKATCNVWKGMDVDIGEFRLMIIVQVSA